MTGREYAELHAFAAVAEQRNFARAAARLGVSPSALSQTVKALETRLGARLLHRTTRSVALSEAGERLLRQLRPALAAIEGALQDTLSQAAQPSGRLRLNSTRLAAQHYLTPLLAPFLARYPGIHLDLEINERLVDIVAEGFDAGIRLGECLERDMIARPLGPPQRLRVVAAPAYLERHGQPRSPADLTAHRCLSYRWPTSGTPYRWEFARGGRQLEIAVAGPLIVNDPELLVRIAVEGGGIAYLFSQLVDEPLATGRLLPLLDAWTPTFPGFHLYYPSRMVSPALRALVDFMQDATAPGSRYNGDPFPSPTSDR
ncbi:DNA-binding transcriptional regulator, LysR family [Pseudomonas flavescens]|uniref:DNA-binding transcriptional regulator, LysR family n=1 Tax=Phytopseudomonas flavescens TaxID=29435 RepID=A0A1G8JT94_9GAMM|nr:LysR family transcriptional regulator [Pseudomonas flavescens]SDI34422.1 DNA-binding transcriptional regulator, LysR family [Pseudomonas flavescens]